MKPRNHVFYLKTPEDANRESSIQYRSHISGELFKYGTSQSIYPGLWDNNTKRPTTDKKIIKEFKTQLPGIETRLNNIKTILENICFEIDSFLSNSELNKTQIDFKALRQHLDNSVLRSNRTKNTGKGNQLLNKTAENGKDFQDIRTYIIYFISAITCGKITIGKGKNYKKRYSDSTIKNYKGFLVQWIEFEKNEKQRFKWVDINQPFYNQFIHYFNSKNYSDNTAGRMVKHLKVILEAAQLANLHHNEEYRKPYFKTLSSKSDNIALTMEEVDKIKNLDLSNQPGWDKAKDIFLIGCYTALRFSDLKRLKREYIKGTFIEIPTQKTKKKITVLINSDLEKILKKCNYQAPKIPEQKVNEYIKKIGKMAGIDQLEHLIETKGGITKETSYKRYELITTHTARRSAATNMLLSGLDRQFIMAITGHTTESSFLKYIILPKEYVMKELSKNAFFK